MGQPDGGLWRGNPRPISPQPVEQADGNRQLAVEDQVKADSIVDGEECWLSNGVRGFFCGKISLAGR